MVLGRFYFKQTLHGNLLGEYSNTGMRINKTESADIISRTEMPFIGNYISTWFEESAESLVLDIQFKIDGDNNLYTLNWRDTRGNTVFVGEGFLVDSLLIGDYRDDELEQHIRNV